jgi:hypothetical protein
MRLRIQLKAVDKNLDQNGSQIMKKFHVFKSWIFSAAWKYYLKRCKEENIAAVNVEIPLYYSR